MSAMSLSSKAIPKPKHRTTFYRRKLPSPPAIAFASPKGRVLFKEAMKDGFMEGYFRLAEQFRTQDEPAFCGLSTLTMLLNTLAVDPKRVWKGAWRWYNESMLDCCRSLDEIKKEGITFDQFACLGRCNSLNMIVKRPNQRHVYPTRDTKEPMIESQVNDSEQKECAFSPQQTEYFSLNEFRTDVMNSCVSSNEPVVIVSYSRKGLSQTGDGHFSPIAGYHKEQDMLLIMDVARFKYPPHWVKTEVLYHAMCRIDPECNKTRGWMIASCAATSPYFFTLNASAIEEQNAVDWNENVCGCLERTVQEMDVKLSSASCGCSQDDIIDVVTVEKVIKCFLNCMPVPLNNYIANQAEKFGIILEESHEEIRDTLMNSIRDIGIYGIVQNIFNEKENVQLLTKFEKCLDEIEMVTLMVLVIGNDEVWNKIADEKLSTELIVLTTIDAKKHPELSHEVGALRNQITNLSQFLLSVFTKLRKDHPEHCCNH